MRPGGVVYSYSGNVVSVVLWVFGSETGGTTYRVRGRFGRPEEVGTGGTGPPRPQGTPRVPRVDENRVVCVTRDSWVNKQRKGRRDVTNSPATRDLGPTEQSVGLRVLTRLGVEGPGSRRRDLVPIVSETSLTLFGAYPSRCQKQRQ